MRISQIVKRDKDLPTPKVLRPLPRLWKADPLASAFGGVIEPRKPPRPEPENPVQFVCGCNFGLLMRTLFGAGTPRGMREAFFLISSLITQVFAPWRALSPPVVQLSGTARFSSPLAATRTTNLRPPQIFPNGALATGC